MDTRGRPARRVAATATATAMAMAMATIALAGCQSGGDPQSSPARVVYGADLIARNGSVVGGTVRVAARDDGVAVNVYATGLPPGSFRLVFHARGNCSSRNVFSAGSPWAPPGVETAVLSLASSTDGTATLSTRLRGYTLEGADGLIGKAVVVHEATGSLDAQPDVANGRIACGVIGSMRTLSF